MFQSANDVRQTVDLTADYSRQILDSLLVVQDLYRLCVGIITDFERPLDAFGVLSVK